MKFRAVRVLQKNGNSYTIALPRAFLLNMRIWRGIEVELVYDDETDVVTVKAINAPPRSVRGTLSHRDVRPLMP